MKGWILAACCACTLNLCAETKILAISGSLREDSVNKKLMLEAAGIARQNGAIVTVVNLRDYPLPFYDADLETKEGMPSKAKELRKLMIHSDVILIASPEYNGSLPAVLKNAIDWLSRSEEGAPSRDAFKGKKFIIMSATPGQGGGTRVLGHLRTIIENVGGLVEAEQVSIPDAYNAFDEQGLLKNPKLKNELQQLVQKIILSPSQKG